ncbi:probable dolichyl-diphosphooligosaccharide--protein glycosyltransferase subunit 3b [Phtheirospermum japonicum]|uniref:Probable dolichyl-diphosphooligosaccharide--protein glycosyltransferase subunit 3b n=1 Tax=Phtheirospermum japonicum TaxID=374723 RepID=A0A830AXJ4_9LAMI|nr:probable dolichyl-diphosphooligosaccharide--protein glycosyltransferase subunit 3b [Phtheirospermum japonicum]
MDASDYSRLAESMSDFIESRTDLSVGPIDRPPPVSKKQIVFIAAVVLALTPFFIKRLISGKTFLHEKNVWMAGAIFVYFFSVSGAMFNIIRKMPMFMADRQDPSKLVFFYQGSGMQLGAEGFAVGFLYTIVGLLLAFVTHVLVRVKNRTVQRVFMIFAMFVSFLAVRKVIFLDNWKTGYGIHGYWPSSWQ